MNAKETLKKIAEALNIVGDKVEAPEVVEPKAEEAKVEAVAEVVEAVEATPEAVVEEAAKEVKETEVEVTSEVETKVVEEDPRVQELEGQLNDLKDLLKAAMAQPEEVKVEVPVEEPKGLTHSPEKNVNKKSTKIGNKGKDTLSRVFKYINN